jgi:hypothetical protein
MSEAYAAVALGMLIEADRIAKKSEKFEFVYKGRKIKKYAMNVDVKGAADRDPRRFWLVWRDTVGRFTLDPLGEAVGLLMRGGFSGRLCHVGLFEEVTRAPGD